jgi:hypothetical protein
VCPKFLNSIYGSHGPLGVKVILLNVGKSITQNADVLISINQL